MTAPTLSSFPAAPTLSQPGAISNRMELLASAVKSMPPQMETLRVYVEGLPSTATPKWNSSTDYAVGDDAWSPTNFISYRCTTAAGPSHGSTTDPASTPARWLNPGAPGSADETKLGYISVSGAVNLSTAPSVRLFGASGAISEGYAVKVNGDGTVSQVGGSPTDAGDWIAIARDAAADGETLRLWWIGNVAGGFTGLTFEAAYYVDDDGAPVLSDTSRPLGYAVSTTEIYITNGGL